MIYVNYDSQLGHSNKNVSLKYVMFSPVPAHVPTIETVAIDELVILDIPHVQSIGAPVRSKTRTWDKVKTAGGISSRYVRLKFSDPIMF